MSKAIQTSCVLGLCVHMQPCWRRAWLSKLCLFLFVRAGWPPATCYKVECALQLFLRTCTLLCAEQASQKGCSCPAACVVLGLAKILSLLKSGPCCLHRMRRMRRMRLSCSLWTAPFRPPVCGRSLNASRAWPRGPASCYPLALPGMQDASRRLPKVSSCAPSKQEEACAGGRKPEQSCMLMLWLASCVLADGIPLRTCLLSQPLTDATVQGRAGQTRRCLSAVGCTSCSRSGSSRGAQVAQAQRRPQSRQLLLMAGTGQSRAHQRESWPRVQKMLQQQRLRAAQVGREAALQARQTPMQVQQQEQQRSCQAPCLEMMRSQPSSWTSTLVQRHSRLPGAW